MGYAAQFPALINEALKEGNEHVAKFILVRFFVISAFSLLCEFQEREKNHKAVQTRMQYWNILGAAMGIVGVGETDDERQGKQRTRTIVFVTIFRVFSRCKKAR